MEVLGNLTKELRNQGLCRFESDIVVVQDFLNNSSACIQKTFPEPSIDFSWYDPYEEPNETLSDTVTDGYSEKSGFTLVWSTVLLNCKTEFLAESLFWITPNAEVLMQKSSQNLSCQASVPSLSRACNLEKLDNENEHLQVLENG